MDETTPEDPLHGMTLKALLTDLVGRHGWSGLAEQIPLRCFSDQPSYNSSLVFLRATPWARTKVERLYLNDKRRMDRNAKRKRRAQAKLAYETEQALPADERGGAREALVLDLGPQPLGELLTQHDLSPSDLVAASTEQVTHRMVTRAVRGRRLSPAVMAKVLRALNQAASGSYALTDLFTYAR